MIIPLLAIVINQSKPIIDATGGRRTSELAPLGTSRGRPRPSAPAAQLAQLPAGSRP